MVKNDRYRIVGSFFILGFNSYLFYAPISLKIFFFVGENFEDIKAGDGDRMIVRDFMRMKETWGSDMARKRRKI